MEKSPSAFRTISEVSNILGVPSHVLRFWESKFSQIKPVKRGGGRRYYRPGDIALIGGIKHLLYEDGLTIKGAQKVLRERGVKAVTAIGQAALDGAETPTVTTPPPPEPPAKPDRSAQLAPLYARLLALRSRMSAEI